MPELPFDPDRAPDPNFEPPKLEIPDVVGVVEGWRAWKVPVELPRYGQPARLYSHNHEYYWVPRRESVAECSQCGENIPGEMHSCGFYSAKTYKHLMTMDYPRYDSERTGMFAVVGRVANWGKVVEASQGWRAQKSYPVLLLVPFEAHRLAKPLAEAYGVPVRLHNFLKPVHAGKS